MKCFDIDCFDLLISGHDVFVVEQALPGTQSLYEFGATSDLGLHPGVLYYTNVVAYNYGGIHLCESSDGFTIDSSKPISGMVYDGIGTYVTCQKYTYIKTTK